MLEQTLLNDTHRIFSQTCRKFVDAHIKPFANEWEEQESFPRELYQQAAQAGVIGSTLPIEYGGGGGDMFHLIVSIENLLRGGSSGVAAGLGSLGIALPPILALGDEAQKQKFIPPVACGARVAALAITEPGAGSDVSGVQLRAERRGDDYVLNGSKTFITSGCRADWIVTLARTGPDPHHGLTFFVVARDMPGFAVSRALKKTGWRASDTAELSYQDVVVPASHRIGEEGSGFKAVMQTFVGERLALATMGHASAEIALEEAVAYAKTRQAFGKTLTGFQVTRHKLAQMATEVAVAKAYNYQLAAAINQGAYVVKEVAMAKNFSAQVAQRVCHEAVQIFGGMGYMRETLVERLSRDVRLLSIGGGTTEIMNEVISKFML